MSFSGFPSETILFLQELAQNNNRPWFTENKQRYKEVVEASARGFMEEMGAGLSALVGSPMQGKLFRVYRDVRFSKDKTPYNAHVRVLFHHQDVASSCGDRPVFCFSLEPERVITGAGTAAMEFSKSTLGAYRRAVAGDKQGMALSKLLKRFRSDDGFRVDPAALKRVPAGYDKGHPREALLRHKALMVWHEEAHSAALHSGKCVGNLLRRYKKMKPVFDWIDAL